MYDVAIVGFGPSGAVAAGLLGQAGIKTVVVERALDVYDKPRAISMDHEILRVFQQLGLDRSIAPFIEPFTPSEYYGADGQLIKRLATVAPPYPLGHTPSMVFSQPPVEKALRDYVQSLPCVDILLGQECVGLTQCKEYTSLNVQRADGALHTIEARYVIACDGASSSVRDQLGIVLEDLQFDEPWLVVDVLVNEKGMAKLPAVSVQYCEPDRPCTYVIGPGSHRRWEISLHEDEDPKLMVSDEHVWKALSRWITPGDATLWRQAAYRFHALVAKEWRKGRVFIAGDAAHQQPPFLGQGMCQGIRDVANLSWKLQAVLTGSATDALLDTYGVERSRHVKSLTARIKDIGSVICVRDLAAARARDAHLLAEAGGQIKTVARQDIIPPLQEGLLAADGHAANGTLFPQPKIIHGDKTRLFDEVAGHGWRVVADSVEILQDNGVREAARILGANLVVVQSRQTPDANVFTETEGILGNWFAKFDCIAAVVRPDNYVYGVVRNSTQLAAQLSDLSRILKAA